MKETRRPRVLPDDSIVRPTQAQRLGAGIAVNVPCGHGLETENICWHSGWVPWVGPCAELPLIPVVRPKAELVCLFNGLADAWCSRSVAESFVGTPTGLATCLWASRLLMLGQSLVGEGRR